MNFRELFHLTRSSFKIRLDDDKSVETFESTEETSEEEKTVLSVEVKNEWHQEYELIYLSYVLER
jgi:hypothetical protein